jgi:formylglycine-generating enzyme required for sulfatase activity
VPEHLVTLDAFYLDTYEVSNDAYQACVASQACGIGLRASSLTRPIYQDSLDFAAYPVIGVTWSNAYAYCQWADERLPTEAEWDYAASDLGNLVWPWGNAFQRARSGRERS